MAEARIGLPKSIVRRAIEGGHLRVGQGPGPRWRSYPLEDGSVGRARNFTAETLADLTKDPDHIDTVAIVVSELVTNAVRYTAAAGTTVHLGIAVLPGWTHVLVEDPLAKAPDIPARKDPEELGEPDLDELLLSGRGLGIVRDLTVRFRFVERTNDKTAHAVVLRTDVSLTRAELAALDRLVSV